MMAPFEYSPEHLVGLHPLDDPEEPFLALGASEHNELWSLFWAAFPHESTVFLGSTTRDAIFSLSAGQTSVYNYGLIIIMTSARCMKVFSPLLIPAMPVSKLRLASQWSF